MSFYEYYPYLGLLKESLEQTVQAMALHALTRHYRFCVSVKRESQLRKLVVNLYDIAARTSVLLAPHSIPNAFSVGHAVLPQARSLSRHVFLHRLHLDRILVH